MAFRRRSIIIITSWFLLLNQAHLQSASAKEDLSEFRVIAMSDLPTLFYDIDNKKEVIHAGMGSFSRLYPAPPNRKPIFYREEPNPDPTKPPLKIPIAKATLPNEDGPFLIVLTTNDPGSDLQFSTNVIDHSLEAHPTNSYRIFNFSKRRMAVRLADHDMLLNTGQSDTVQYPETRKAWLKVAADTDEEGWLVVTSSSHAVGSNARTTIFLVDIPPSERDPDPKGVAVRKMRERIVTDEFGVQHIR